MNGVKELRRTFGYWHEATPQEWDSADGKNREILLVQDNCGRKETVFVVKAEYIKKEN